MPVVDHLVSFRNGSQIMVRGLQLGERLGYCRNARVQVTDPTGNAANVPWAFVVPNDEHATLVSNNPAPPQWIQPGVRIRIDVQPPVVAITESAPSDVAVRLPDTPTPAPVERAAESPKSRLELPPHVVYAVDVGAPGAGLAWACLAPQAGQIPFGSMVYDQFLDSIVRDLRADLPVALGFEAPMFLHVAPAFGDLTRARIGEPAAWSFGAGSYVTTIATPLMAFTLRHIRSQITPAPRVTLDPARWLAPDAPGPHLLLWEAFVSGDAHAREANAAGLAAHLQDAATAVRAFVLWEGANPRPQSDVTAHDPISTVGAAVLWSGFCDDVRLLHQQVLVLRPTQLLGTDIVAFMPGGATGA